MRTLVVIQARKGSSRLPGKVLLPLAGQPLLVRMVERVSAARMPFELVVATTTDAGDDEVARLCLEREIACYRGHPTDLLDRHVGAARARDLGPGDLVVKIPSDCPLIDPGVIDRVLSSWRSGLDYLGNLHPGTWPDGNDVEVMTLAALQAAWREATRPHEREHTTPFLWDQPLRFRCANVTWGGGRDLSRSHRFTIDYPEDYKFIASVFDALHAEGRVFPLAEILELLGREPQLLALNARYAGVNWYRHHLAELRTVRPGETREPGEPAL
jgi:spore coat polysaccharide biosynthesis protein SpsF